MYTVKAIRKDTNEWISGYLWQGSSYAGIIPHNLGVNIDKNKIEATIYEVYPDTICRAVGVDAYWYDKKSGGHVIPLYENDIVQYRKLDCLYEGAVINRHGAYVIHLSGYDEYTYLQTVKDINTSFINVQIIGNKYDTPTKPEKPPVEAKKDNVDAPDECPYFEQREIGYDVMSGHSDYEHYCTKDYDKKIVKCVHCTLCKQKGANA